MDNIFFILRFSLSSFLLFFGYLLNAQQLLTFSENNEKINYRAISDCQIGYLFTLYNQKIDNSNELVNGRDYFPYYYRSELKPILFNQNKKSGSLVMNGKKYDNLTLDYDTYLDELIYYDRSKFIANKSLSIALNKEIVEGFNLYFDNDSLIFRYCKSSDNVKFDLPEGFYEVVYDGNSKYIIKHQSEFTVMEGLDEYLYSPAGYVMVGENFSRVRSKKGFVKLFGDKSKEIKKFMRSNRIHIKKEEKNKIASVLKYYDSLILSNQ
jgi:hypothetical protein